MFPQTSSTTITWLIELFQRLVFCLRNLVAANSVLWFSPHWFAINNIPSIHRHLLVIVGFPIIWKCKLLKPSAHIMALTTSVLTALKLVYLIH